MVQRFHQQTFDNLLIDLQKINLRVCSQALEEVQEKEVQVSVGWIELSATSPVGSNKLLIYPNGDNEPISVLEKRILSLVPTLEPAQDGDRSSFLDISIITRSPCPADSYGKELHVAMKRLEIVLYEEILEGLLDSIFRLKSRIQALGSSESPSPSVSLAIDFDSPSSSISPIGLRPSSASLSSQSSSAPGGRYSSLYCLVNVNGPTAYFVPSGLLRPVFKFYLTTIFLSGHLDLTLPKFEMTPGGSSPPLPLQLDFSQYCSFPQRTRSPCASRGKCTSSQPCPPISRTETPLPAITKRLPSFLEPSAPLLCFSFPRMGNSPSSGFQTSMWQ